MKNTLATLISGESLRTSTSPDAEHQKYIFMWVKGTEKNIIAQVISDLMFKGIYFWEKQNEVFTCIGHIHFHIDAISTHIEGTQKSSCIQAMREFAKKESI